MLFVAVADVVVVVVQAANKQLSAVSFVPSFSSMERTNEIKATNSLVAANSLLELHHKGNSKS